MVELDDFLMSTPVQHRECQNYESERFLNYFKQFNGIKYQNGGVASGLHHYERKFEPRLFQIKGKRVTRLIELNSIDWSSLNRCDSFLIDLNSTIFIWNGKNANKMEKLQALYKSRSFRDERNGECNIVIVEDGEEKEMSKEVLKLFESRFPLKEKMSKLKNEISNSQNDDLKTEREYAAYLKLYK
jgi:gelsolin